MLSCMILLACLPETNGAQTIPIPDHGLWPRPEIIPAPVVTTGAGQPVLSLAGIWKIRTQPPPEYWSTGTDISAWTDVEVPGQADMLGIPIRRDQEYAYARLITIPEDYSGKRIFLRFEGVTGNAKAWINGHFLKEHHGGFNIWNCDVTDYVTPGKEALLTVGIVDPGNDRTSSGFNNGGIIRDVKLMAVAPDHLVRFNIETDLDEDYMDATMKVWIGAGFHQADEMEVELTLTDPQGIKVPLEESTITLSRKVPEVIMPFNVRSPMKWDAEHPRLYTLSASIMESGQIMQTIRKKIGFREVEIKGVRMFINGMEVKLRGGGRFDSDPVYGRYLSPEQALREVRMLKSANLNHVRPSCYPATQEYLDACDSIGLYVQAENAVTFDYDNSNDTALTAIYMSQMAEMVETDRSHPSIIIWELANETPYGINIAKTHRYARAEDPTRPVIFSWSQSVPEGEEWPYEIFSYHYPDWDTDLGTPGVAVFNSPALRPLPQGMPVLHDEFAHGSCYYPSSLKRDPGIRNFWGESIKLFWERMFTTEGCLGGAQWAVIDENASLDRAFEWGPIDLWRRPRAEYWLMKKAYSPVRIQDKPLENPGKGNILTLPVRNWHDHTNLDEIRIKWSAGTDSGMMAGPGIAPHDEGVLEFAARNWQDGEVLSLEFYHPRGMLIDNYNLAISPAVRTFPGPEGPAPELEKDSDRITVSGKDFEIVFNRSDGLIEHGKYKEVVLLKGGPYFHLTGGEPVGDWQLETLSAGLEGNEAVVMINGSNDPVEVLFEVRIDGKGLITTRYTLEEFGVQPPSPRRRPWNDQDAGGFEEVGIYYILTENTDRLSWHRNGLWSVYPDDHIGRNKGVAHRNGNGEPKRFGEPYTRAWSQDERDFNVFGRYDVGGRGTNDFRSMKEYIYQAEAITASDGARIRVESDGTQAVRLEVVPDYRSYIDNSDERIRYSGQWNPSEDSMVNYGDRELWSTSEGDFAEFSFEGTGFCWIGSKNRGAGTADIYIDGDLAAEGVNLSSRRPEPGSILFSKDDLETGRHTVKIVARPAFFGMRSQTGEDNRTAGIPLDAIQVVDGEIGGEVKMVLNDHWNYTKLGLGNYMKDPILINPGHQAVFHLRMVTDPDTQ